MEPATVQQCIEASKLNQGRPDNLLAGIDPPGDSFGYQRDGQNNPTAPARSIAAVLPQGQQPRDGPDQGGRLVGRSRNRGN